MSQVRSQPQTTKAVHIPGLNGLRAMAALMVLFAHATRALNEFGLDRMVLGADPNGNPYGSLQAGMGVTIFFAISGFLITSLLLLEKQQGISIRKFYIRRILRIWPLYFLYLGIVLIVLWQYNIEYRPANLLWYVFLGANIPFILGGAIPMIGHYWSLGVEEQFYAVWPVTIKKSGRARLIWIIGCILLLLLAIKVYARWINISRNDATLFNFINTSRYDCMIIGGLAAVIYADYKQRIIPFATHILTQLFSWGVLVFFLANFRISTLIDHEIIAVCTVFIIIAQAERRNRIFNLENGFWDFLGKISYGIYVWHPLIILLLQWILVPIECGTTWNYLMVYAAIFASTILIAYLSYTYFECIFLRIKTKFTIVHSSSTRTPE